MTRSRGLSVLVVALCSVVFPVFASAATTDFRVLFDWDNNAATGCSVSGMIGVDQVLTTRVVTDSTTGNVTRTFRQVCTAGVLGPETDAVTTGWPAGFQPANGNIDIETRIPFGSFPSGLQPNMRLGVAAGEGTVSHIAIVHPNGDPILFPTPSRGKRRSVGTPGDPRVITLDGQLTDWTPLDALVDGIAASGSPGLRIIKFWAYADHVTDFYYFAFQANLSADAPFANDDNYQRPEGAGLSVPAPGVLANDGDPAGNPLTAAPVSSPSHGTLTLNPDGSFTYTPDNPASTQADAFEYRASNGTKSSNAARVRITVQSATNVAPNAVDDAYSTPEDEQLNVPAATGVLANDTDANGDVLTATLLVAPTRGTVVLAADGGFTYTPNDDLAGDDTFTYTVDDGTGSDSALVTITVIAENDAPTVDASTMSVVENSFAGTVVGTVSASDVEGDTLTFSIEGGNNGNAFAINASTGEISVNDPTALDFETNPQFFLIIRAVDSGTPSRSDEATITINVTNANDAPVAAADGGYTVAEGGTLNGTSVLANDTDQDGDTLTALLVGGPANASSFTLNADGTFTYVHNGGETSSDSFTYRANDGSSDSDVVTVSISITAVNDAPVAVADSGYTVAEGGTLNGTSVLANDSDPDGDPLTAVLVSGPANAAAFTLNADGTFTYTHNGSETASDSFTYEANDGALDSNTVTVTISVTLTNDAPIAVADAGYTVAEGGTLNGTTVLVNDTDGDGDPLTAVLVSGPANAAAFTLNADGTFTYTHNGSETIVDSFTYQANDGTQNSNIVTVTIAVTPVNDAPVAVADSGYTVAEGGTLNGTTVLANDTDAEGGPLTAVLVSGPSNDSAFTLNADGTFTYTHDGSETTSDSFTYRANDGSLDSNTVTVSITITGVNDAPVAVADSGYTVAEGGTLNGTTVLANDTDAEGNALTAVLVSGPANSSGFTLNADGTFTYTHDGSETTADSFTYEANDGSLDSNTVTVTIAITAVNDAPVAVADSGYTVAEGGTITAAATVLVNDTDAEGDALTATLVSGPANAASFTFNTDGTFDYTHNGGETTTDSFTYRANDGSLDSNTVTVTIAITPVNDAPVAVADSGYAVNEGGTLNGTTVLGNDTDPENDTLTAVLVSGPSNASSFTLNADGTFTYTHNGSETTSDSFTYRANDGALDSNTVTVSITVNPVNDAPVAVADSGYTVAEGGTLNATTVLANDTDAEGDTLTAVVVSGPSNASSFTLNADGTFTYTHNGSETTSDSFTYQANDGSLNSNTVTVSITVTPVNDAPVAVADGGYSVAEGGTLTGAATVLGNDSDAEGNTLTAVLVSGPSNASSFTLNANGSFDYTHDGSETTSDSFTYRANDGALDSNIVTVSITINSQNDAPVLIVPGAQAVDEDTPLVINASVTDADAGSGTAELQIGCGNCGITLASTAGLTFTTGDGTNDASIVATGTIADISAAINGFTYQGTPNFNGGDTITITVSDLGNTGAGGTMTDTETIAVTVNAINDDPVAVADSGYTVDENGNVTGASSVLGNDVDADGDTLTAVLDAGPANASAFTLNADGTFDYTHDGSETTTDSFTYHANDGTANSNTVTVSITITSQNDAPVLTVPGAQAVNEDTPLVINASVTDADAGSGTSELQIACGNCGITLASTAGLTFTTGDGTNDASIVATGTIADISAAINGFTYQGTPNFNGGDTITITVSDLGNTGAGGTMTDTETIAVTVNAVNDDPVAVADSGYTVDENGSVTGASSVLGNDTDADGNTLTAVLDAGPANASAFTLNADGTFDYTHDGSETTSDSFTYHANDGTANSNTVTVSITITSQNDAPVLTVPGAQAVNEDTALVINASVTDADAGSGTAELQIGCGACGITLASTAGLNITTGDGTDDASIVATGTIADISAAINGFTYQGVPNFNGGDTITIIVSDFGNTGAGGTMTDTETIAVTVNAVNDDPVAVADSGYTIAEGGSVTGASSVLGNDTDADGNTLTAVLDAGPANASSFTLNADGTFDYTHDGSETTSDSFTYHANDGTANSNTVTVSITITASNDAPVATADAYTVAEGGTLNESAATGVLANDTDVDSSITAVLVSGPANASSFTLNADGSFTYTHDGSETTTDSFTYKANDGSADSNTVAVTITVTAVNDAPVAVADAYSVAEGGTLTETVATGVLANDSDAETGITAILVSGPANASAFTLNADGSFTYTHDGSETITDSFTYKANDGTVDSNTVTVTITVTAVNDAPVATADNGTVNEGGTLSVSGVTSVLANDTDAENDTLTAVMVTGPSNASSFTLGSDGSYTYVHNGGETTSDSFTYKANDGALDSNTVTVSITVNAVNDAPVANDDNAGSVAEGGTLNGTTVLTNDTDAENDTLTAILVSGPSNASSFTLNADGTFTYQHNGTETGSDSFTYKANDGTADSNVATVSITITPVNDAPTAVADNGGSVAEGGTLNGTSVLTNDSDPENDTITAVLVTGPANDSAFTLNPNGTFSYTHDGSETTSDSFTYKANDGFLDSNTVTVSITITGVNDAPVAVDDNGGSVAEGGTLSGTTVLANDTDAEGTTLTAVLVTGPVNDAGFTLNSDGTFTYTHDGGESTADSFTYVAYDGDAQSNTATVTITITAVNDAPVAVADSGYSVDEAGTITGAATVLSNDTDAEGTTLTAVLDSGPSSASSFTLNSDGTFDYTHDGGEDTSDSFTYHANDGTADSNVVTVAITIDPVNDEPSFTKGPDIVADSNAGAHTSDPWATGVTAGFEEDPAQDVTFVIDTNDNTGLFTAGPSVDPTGALTFTPVAGATGTANITLHVTDDGGTTNGGDDASATQSFTISIDDAPTVTSTTPTESAVVATNHQVSITFSEAVTLTGTWFQIVCASSGTHDPGNSSVGGGAVTYTIDTAGFTQGESCAMTIFGAQVTDNDTIDGPNAMVADATVNFTVDAQPSVTTITPADTATGVVTSSNIDITFSENVTVTAGSFDLDCTISGANVAFTLSGSGASYTLNPDASLAAGETCTVTVLAAQVDDADAIDPPANLAADFVSTFDTDAAPFVSSTTPANGATALVGTDIDITFSEPVDATGSSFTINCTVSGSHTYVLGGNPTTYTLNPNTDFTAGETCTVTVIAVEVDDQDTNDPPANMAADYVFSFQFDETPSVVSTSPVNGSTNSATDVNLVITYSEPVTAGGTAYTLTCTPSATPRAFVLSGNGTAVHTLDPNINLSAGQTCTVNILATQITDVDANDPPDNMAANYSFSFTTDANPQITIISPNDGSTVAQDANFSMTWTEPVTMTAVGINCTVSGNHTNVLSTGDNITWTVNPDTDYTPGETCTVTVLSANVTDDDTNDPPNNPGPDISWQYTVDVPPSVQTTTPADNATDVAGNANVVITFSEPVNIGTNAITVSCATSGSHTYAITANPATTFTLDPDTDFTQGELCTVTVPAAQVTDNDGFDPPNNMTADHVFDFTIDLAPFVSSTDPADNDTDGQVAQDLTITFSEPVDVTGTWFDINCTISGAHTAVVTGGPTTFTVNPDTNFSGGDVCTVQVFAANVTDQDSNDPPDNMTADYTFDFTVDEPPSVVSTSPTNGATNSATNVNIVITYDEPVTAGGTAYDIDCGPFLNRPFVLSGNGTAVHTLDPSSNLPAGQTCTVNILATQITDVDANDPPDQMVANYSFSFTTDANPQIVSTSPNDGSTVASNLTFSMTWTETVTMTAVGINCTVSGNHTNVLSTSDNITWTVNPDTDFTQGETCTITVLSANVTDDDTNDPPDNPGPDISWQYNVDAQPSVTLTAPVDNATGVTSDTNVVITFSESVNIGTNAITVNCATSGAHAYGITANPATTFTLDPTVDFAPGELCTVTVPAAQVADNDSVDPPDNLAADYVFDFTIDAQPNVTTTVPVDETIDVVRTTNITINFSEPVDTSLSSFTIKCPSTGSAIAFAFVGASTNTNTVTLDPGTNLPDGERCEVTVIANQVNDTDANDPPANLPGDFTFQFGVEPNADPDTHPHTHVGNINSSSDGFLTVVTNDDFPVAFPITSLTFDGTTANGGTIVMNNTIGSPDFGEFTYNPPPGFEGTDTFNYTITTANGTDSAAVSIPVSGMIWFINQNDGVAPHDGRIGSPFQTLAQFEASGLPGAGDHVFLYESGTAYTGPITLDNNSRLIGQDSTVALFGAGSASNLTPAASQAAGPTVDSANGIFVNITSAGVGVNLASNNHVRGMRFGNNTGLAMNGGAVGTLVVTDAQINNGTGGGISLTGGTSVSVSLASTSTTGGTHGISLNNVSGTVSAGTGTISNPTTAAISITGQNPSVTHNGTISITNGRPGLLTTNMTGGSISLNTVNVSNAAAATANDAVTLDGTGSDVDLTITSATLNTTNMDDGLVLSDLASGSAVTVSGGTFTTTGANKRVLEVTGNVNCNCNLSAVTLTANGSEGILLPSTHSGTWQFGDADVNTPNSGIGVQVIGNANSLDGDSTVSFRSIDVATCSQAGIYVHSHSGSFAVNGTGAVNSGGTISNCADWGARFGQETSTNTGAKNITLTDMFFNGNGTANNDPAGTCGDGKAGLNTNCAANIDLQNVNTATLTKIRATGSVQMGINGRNVTDLVLSTVEVDNNGNEALEDGIQIHNLLTTSQKTWSGLNLHDNTGRQLEIQNASGTNDLIVNTSSFIGESTVGTFPSSTTGAQGVLFAGNNAGTNVKITINNATYTRNYSAAFTADTAGGADVTVIVDGGSMNDNGQNFTTGAAGSGDLTYTLRNMTVMYQTATALGGNTNVTGIAVLKSLTHTGSMTGTITNNVIGNASIARSGGPCAGCNGISVRNEQTSGTHNLEISNNTIQRSFGGGISIFTGNQFDTSTMNIKMYGNNVTGPDGAGNNAIIVVNGGGAPAPTSSNMCADIGGAGALKNNVNNTSVGGSAGSWLASDALRVRAATGNVRMPNLATFTTAGAAAHLTANNTLGAGLSASAGGTGTWSGGAAPCF